MELINMLDIFYISVIAGLVLAVFALALSPGNLVPGLGRNSKHSFKKLIRVSGLTILITIAGAALIFMSDSFKNDFTSYDIGVFVFIVVTFQATLLIYSRTKAKGWDEKLRKHLEEMRALEESAAAEAARAALEAAKAIEDEKIRKENREIAKRAKMIKAEQAESAREARRQLRLQIKNKASRENSESPNLEN